MEKTESGAGRMAKHSSIYAIGNISRKLVGFIMLPIYTRCLTPADFGVVGLLTFAISLIEAVFGARLMQAVPKFYYEQEQPDDKNAVISTALIITGFISTISMFMLMLFRESTSVGLFDTGDFALVIGLFSVQILTLAIEDYALLYIRIQQKPILFISVSLTKLAFQLSLNIWLVVFLDLGVTGVAISAATSSIVFALGLGIYTAVHTGLAFRLDFAYRQLIFCWPLWVAGFAALYTGSASQYYIKLFGSLDEVGLYTLGARFAVILSVLIWMPFGQYWQTERFNYYHRGNAIPIFQTVFKFISTIMVLAALGICVFATPVVRVMATPAFYEATKVIPFLTFAVLLHNLSSFLDFSFLVKEKTGWISRNNYLTAAIITVFYLALIPSLGFVGAGVAIMLARGVQFTLMYRASRQFYDMQLDIRPMLCMAAIAGAGAVAAAMIAPDASFWVDLLFRTLIFIVTATAVAAVPLADPQMREKVWRFILPFCNKLKGT